MAVGASFLEWLMAVGARGCQREAIGKRVRDARNKLGITQEKLSELLKIMRG